MAAFLRGKGKILWDVIVNTTFVHPVNYLAPRSRDMHDANNNAVGDSPRGPLKQWGKPHLKPATKPKYVEPNHAGA
jgi:hypothetical protein